MTSVRFAQVAVFVPLSQAYTFSIPDELAGSVVHGCRVLCLFRNRQTVGVVLETGEGDPGIDPSRLKPILAVLDEQPALSEELLGFLQQLSNYYLAPIGEVMRLAVPAVQRSRARAALTEGEGKAGRLKAVGRTLQAVRLRPSNGQDEQPSTLKGQAAVILERLRIAGEVPLVELTKEFGNARSAVKKLAGLGLVELVELEYLGDPLLDGASVERDSPPELNPHQREAVSALCEAMRSKKGGAFLLHGVTASGKTEVYLHAVSEALELGYGSVVLVPEISLTPQLVGRFRARLGNTIAVLHSGLTDTQRYGMWKRLREGKLRVAVGARSALFAPVANLGLLCVDEEQDHSFKQEEGVRYHARDMALLRAHRAGAVCVLGSATPSLQTVHGVQSGRVSRLALPQRAHAQAVLPECEVVDLRRFGPGPTGHRLLTLPLIRALEATIERQEQAILFLNRRGFAPALVCESCGTVVQCRSCEVALTYHRSPRDMVLCHYCDYRDALPSHCGACKSPRLSLEGTGTEGIEAAVSEALPKARVGRLDRDTGAGLKSDQLLQRMRQRELDILVGTQMVTKGHDLPDVTLVGVLNADSGLSMPDFQASERTFQLLVQVAGRAGRAGKQGRVIVQTRAPEHPAIALALRHDVAGFIQYGLGDRKDLGYPPYSRLALVRVSALEEGVAQRAAADLAQAANAETSAVEVLGPSPAPLAKLRGRHRYRVMLRAKERSSLRRALLAVLRTPIDPRVRRVVDVDPVSML